MYLAGLVDKSLRTASFPLMIVVEPHASGALHWHGITGLYRRGMLDYHEFLQAWPYGWGQIRETEDLGAVAQYATKYMVKYLKGDNYDFWPEYQLSRANNSNGQVALGL